MELRPVSLAQVLKGRDGREYEISGEAATIAARLHEIDSTLSVHVNETGYFVVSQLVDAGGNATTVETDTTERKCVRRIPWDQWDGRVVKEFEQRAFELRNGISAADRLDALDAQKSADAEYAMDQEVRERAFPLFRAMQREMSMKPRAFIRKGLAA